jgi:general secretion pathway protein A
MYMEYWKLARRPFDERIDPQWFFASGVHRGTRVHLQAIVDQEKPVALLVGAVGSGKSMVAASLADGLTESHPALALNVIPATALDTLQEMLDELHHSRRTESASASNEPGRVAGCEYQPNRPAHSPDLPQRVVPRRSTVTSEQCHSGQLADAQERLRKQLSRRRLAGQHVVAFLDGADVLSDTELRKLLRALRELAGNETAAMTAFVIGSPELLGRSRRLTRDSERIFPQCLLGTMSPTDTALYVRHRVQRAGGDPEIFAPPSIALIHDLCGGVPRRVNRLCDLCLLAGYSKNCEFITEGLVWTAQQELSVLAPSRTAMAPPTRRWRSLGKRLSLQ